MCGLIEPRKSQADVERKQSSGLVYCSHLVIYVAVSVHTFPSESVAAALSFSYNVTVA